MAKFSTHLSLGQIAYGVVGRLDYRVSELTVGQIQVTETIPSARLWPDDPVFKEEYMCKETGVGSGQVWTYGKNIFATREEAERGVITHEQVAYFQRAERDKTLAEVKARREAEERRELARLAAKYQGESVCESTTGEVK